jgi:hypothetical protein
LEDALSGVLVGFQKTNDWDLSETGLLEFVGSRYQVYINGYRLYVENTGKVVECKPANSSYLNQTLKMVTADMGNEGAVGGAITRSSGSSGAGHDDQAILTNIEPRDQFAVQVLNAMLIHTEHPEAFDDAKCLMYSRAAYRWAQAMMISAADSREGQSTTPSTGVDVNSGDLQSNTEKLLYNIGEYMKNGMAVKNVTEAYNVPTIQGGITITASIFKQKFIRFEVSTMVYSDVSVYLTLTTNDGARNVGHIIPKGSVVVLMPLDDAVTDITAINSKSIRGKGGNDPNTYTFA